MVTCVLFKSIRIEQIVHSVGQDLDMSFQAGMRDAAGVGTAREVGLCDIRPPHSPHILASVLELPGRHYRTQCVRHVVFPNLLPHKPDR